MTVSQAQPRSPKISGEKSSATVEVWDLPTRLFHWVLVVLVIVSFATAKIGGIAMENHIRCGVAILVLVLFRIVWGVVGSQESRFTSFVRGPATVLRYAATLFSTGSTRHLGHNPLGGWSVVALLACLLIQAGTGLFANDDILTEGPLFPLVTKETSDFLTGIHHLNHSLLLILAGVHVCAILFYLFYKRENLILPMISGRKTWHRQTAPAKTSGFTALAIFVILAAAIWGGLYLSG